MAGCHWDWLVVDHYGIDARWERAMRPSARSILAIDDLADRSHDCDVLLDQNLQRSGAARYQGLVPEQCRKLLGPRFALLRPEFRDGAVRERTEEVRRINVFFGGGGVADTTIRVLNEIAPLIAKGIDVDVILGASDPGLKAVQAHCDSLGVRLHVQTEEIANLFAAADLGIGAGGGASLERCRMGLPSIVVSVAENQRLNCKALAQAGVAVCLGEIAELLPGAVYDAVRVLISSSSTRLAMRRRSQSLVDGRGTDRVLLTMLRNRVTVRSARAEDADVTWVWRDHPNTRRFSHDPMPLTQDTHLSWWKAAVSDPDRALLIAQCAGLDIGVLRFDFYDCRALVSVYLDPALIGLGLGGPVLRAGADWLALNRGDVRYLDADILPQNAQSAKVFRSVGFVRQDNVRWTRALNSQSVPQELEMRGGE